MAENNFNWDLDGSEIDIDEILESLEDEDDEDLDLEENDFYSPKNLRIDSKLLDEYMIDVTVTGEEDY